MRAAQAAHSTALDLIDPVKIPTPRRHVAPCMHPNAQPARSLRTRRVNHQTGRPGGGHKQQDCTSTSTIMPRWLAVVACLLAVAMAATAQEAYELQFDVRARGSVDISLPRMLGPNSELLLPSVDGSRLQYGVLEQLNDWTYSYTTIYDKVDPKGCVDVATYTLSDGKGLSSSANVTINIAANKDPYAAGIYKYTSVNRAQVINVTESSSDPDGDVVRVVGLGTPRYGSVNVSDNIVITYTPTLALVKPLTGALDVFSYSITDGRGGSAQGIIEVTISPNRDPGVVGYHNNVRVHKNKTVLIDLGAQGANETTYPINDADGDANITATADFSSAKLGTVKQVGNGLYEYTAFPGISNQDEHEVFAVTVTDGRGGSAAAQLTVVVLMNSAPYIAFGQTATTLSKASVVIAPLVVVRSYDGDDRDLQLVNISTPVHGTLELLSCCNSVTTGVDWFYTGGKQVADYRYTPRSGITTDLVENLTFTAGDGKGGFVTGNVTINIKAGPSCTGEVEGVKVSGIIHTVNELMDGVIPQCGGAVTWYNCFSEKQTTSRNIYCNIARDGYFTAEDVYGQLSPYSPPTAYVCVLPSRKLPCRPKSNPQLTGVTMWQTLGTELCSAECEMATQGYTLPNSYVAAPADCDICINCKPGECIETPSGTAIGPEICCVGASASGNATNITDPGSPPPRPACSTCTGQPAAPVCGSDGNTYVSTCMAACQGVDITAQGVCEDTPTMLDLTQVPDLRSSEARQMMRDGFQVLGVARTTSAPDGVDGFPMPDVSDVVSAATANWRTPKLQHFQVRFISVDSKNQSALAGGLNEATVRKIYDAYKKIAKVSQVSLPNPKGKRVGWSLLRHKMTYPFSAIGLLGAANKVPEGYCTGWLIRPSLVVTAAHCVFDHKTRLPIWPGDVRFLPQVWGGRTNDKLKGRKGYPVRALAIPGWYEQLGISTATRTTEEAYVWDMAMLYLSEPVACERCLLRPAITVGSTKYVDRLQVAGYGMPAATQLQLNMSLPCDAALKPNMAYAYTKCSTFKGTSGSPYWPAAVAAERDVDMPGAPVGVLPYSWPAFGVHSGTTKGGANAVMMQFTRAHLKWLYWAGAKKATYLACTGSDAERFGTNCVAYKEAGK